MSFAPVNPSPDPMDLAHLRPTATLEMMDNVFAIFRTRARLFLGIGLLAQLPMVAVIIGYPLLSNGAALDWGAPAFRQWIVLAVIIQMWPIAALIGAAFQTILFPTRPLVFGRLMRAAFTQLPQLILTRMLARILIEILAAVAIISVQQMAGGGTQILMLGMGIWAMLALVYFSIVWALIGPVVMIERRGLFRALSRSVELMRLRFGKGFFGDTPIRRLLIVGLFPLSMMLAGRVVIAAVSVAVTGEFSFISSSNSVVIGTEAITDLLLGSVYLPWMTIALVAIYVECRMRREGLDMQVRLLAKGELANEEALEAR